MKRFQFMIIALVLGVVSLASAEPMNPDVAPANNPPVFNKHQGWYASANLGVATGASTNSDGSLDGGLAGVGGALYLGYQLNKNFAIEAGATGLDVVFGSLVIIDGAIKGIIPIGQRVTIFGKVGGAAAISTATLLGFSATSTNAAVFVGAGMGVGLSHSLTATLQYNGVVSSNINTDGLIGLLSLGLDWHFAA